MVRVFRSGIDDIGTIGSKLNEKRWDDENEHHVLTMDCAKEGLLKTKSNHRTQSPQNVSNIVLNTITSKDMTRGIPNFKHAMNKHIHNGYSPQ